MLKNKIGFTFVELMVVVSIICIISIYGVFSFLNNQNYTSLNQEIISISDNMNDYDKRIGNDISDYEFNFYVGKDYYIVSTNNYYKNITQSLTMGGSYTGTLKTNSTSGTLNLDFYKNGKYLESRIISATSTLDYSFSGGSYNVKSNISSLTLNDLYFNLFSAYNESGDLQTITVSDIKDSNGTSLTFATIKNNLSKNKQIIGNGQTLNKITLYFEKNGITSTLDIKN